MHQRTLIRRARLPSVSLSAPPRVDVAISAAFVALTVAEALYMPAVTAPVPHLAVAVPAMIAIAWRRRFPLAVAALAVAANIALNPTGELSALLALVLLSFTIGSETEPPRSYLGLALMLVPFVTAMVLDGFEPSDGAAAMVFLVGPWIVGTATQQRSVRASEAVARADRLEREQEQQAAAAVEQERTRIARELHDIVSHSLSVITIQTQAVRRRLGTQQAREADDLASVESTAREALAEMRRLFGVLRATGEVASLAPQPGLADLDRLLDQARSSGLIVDHRVEGERYELQPGVDLAAYRILQEALTNVIRHSGADHVTVSVSYAPGQLSLTVEDDGRGLTGTPADATTTGHGLVGVRERVTLYGGDVDIGAGGRSGVRLTATLPVRDPA